MKKKWILALVALCCVTTALGFSACDDGDSLSYKVTTRIDKMVANISSAESLAIVKRDSLTESGTATVSMMTAKEKSGNHRRGDELVLAKVEGEQITEVEFEGEMEQYKIFQSDFDAEIYKMKVAGDFTFVAYISSNIRTNLATAEIKYEPHYDRAPSFSLRGYNWYGYQESIHNIYREYPYYNSNELYIYDRAKGVWQNFDELGYLTHDYMQSYAIYNPTGKIYSMSELPAFDVVGDNVGVRRKHADYGGYEYNLYSLSIDANDNLVLEEVLPNRDMTVYNVHTDPYGWKYIYNSGVKQTVVDKKSVYYMNEFDYLFDKDGYAYTTKEIENISRYVADKKIIEGAPTSLNGENIYGLTKANIYGISYMYWLYDDWKQNNISQAIIGDWAVFGTEEAFIVAFNQKNGVGLHLPYEQDAKYFWADEECTLLCKFGKDNSLRYCKIDWSQPFGLTEEDFAAFDILNSTQIPIDFKQSIWSDPVFENAIQSDYWLIQNLEVTCFADVYAVAGLNGTAYYMLAVSADQTRIVPVLIATNTYQFDCLVIEPLN